MHRHGGFVLGFYTARIRINRSTIDKFDMVNITACPLHRHQIGHNRFLRRQLYAANRATSSTPSAGAATPTSIDVKLRNPNAATKMTNACQRRRHHVRRFKLVAPALCVCSQAHQYNGHEQPATHRPIVRNRQRCYQHHRDFVQARLNTHRYLLVLLLWMTHQELGRNPVQGHVSRLVLDIQTTPDSVRCTRLELYFLVKNEFLDLSRLSHPAGSNAPARWLRTWFLYSAHSDQPAFR